MPARPTTGSTSMNPILSLERVYQRFFESKVSAMILYVINSAPGAFHQTGHFLINQMEDGFYRRKAQYLRYIYDFGTDIPHPNQVRS